MRELKVKEEIRDGLLVTINQIFDTDEEILDTCNIEELNTFLNKAIEDEEFEWANKLKNKIETIK